MHALWSLCQSFISGYGERNVIIEMVREGYKHFIIVRLGTIILFCGVLARSAHACKSDI